MLQKELSGCVQAVLLCEPGWLVALERRFRSTSWRLGWSNFAPNQLNKIDLHQQFFSGFLTLWGMAEAPTGSG
jgi:hypothetical protein